MLRLKQTLAHAVDGYWDGGPKKVFRWRVDADFPDGKSRVGSWEANHYFEVRTGKTAKQTLGYAKQHLRSTVNIESTFEYVEE